MPSAASTNLFRWSALAGALALSAGFITARTGQLSHRTLPGGLKSPTMALELLRTADELDRIAPPNDAAGQVVDRQPDDRERLRRAVQVDFAFIVAYAAFFAVTGLLMLAVWPRVPAGALLVLLGIAAALFDVQENREMLDVLAGGAAVPRWASLWKWRFLFAASLVAVPILVDRATPLFRRTLGYVGVLLGIIAGVQGLFAGYEQNDQLIEAAAGKLTAMFTLSVVFLATRRVLGDGVLPALDRLASWRVLGWLKDWPSKDDEVRHRSDEPRPVNVVDYVR
jgi:hypothetical protein